MISRLVARLRATPLSYVFPTVLMMLNLAAAVASFHSGDWRRGICWLAWGICLAMVAYR